MSGTAFSNDVNKIRGGGGGTQGKKTKRNKDGAVRFSPWKREREIGITRRMNKKEKSAERCPERGS